MELLDALYPGRLWKDAPQSTRRAPSIIDVFSQIDCLIAAGRSLSGALSVGRLREVRFMLAGAVAIIVEEQGAAAQLKDPRKRDLAEAARRSFDDRLDLGTRLDVVTTNYDQTNDKLILHPIVSAQPNLAPEVCDPSFTPSPMREVDFGFDYRDVVTGDIVTRPQAPEIGLYKLHGSTTWLRCPLCGFVYINRYGSIAHQPLRADKDQSNICHCSPARLESVLTAPSFVRNPADFLSSPVWSAALEALRTARRWVFVGYSLPPDDIAVRTLLLQAWHARFEQGPLRIVVVDFVPPESRDKGPGVVEQRYRELFGDLTFHPDGFEARLSDPASLFDD